MQQNKVSSNNSVTKTLILELIVLYINYLSCDSKRF